MRNSTNTGNRLLGRAIATVRSRLPPGWAIVQAVREPRGKVYRPDALLDVRAPDGSKARLVVEAKQGLTAAQVVTLAPQLNRAARENGATESLVMAAYLSPLARERLVNDGVSFIDMTGNVKIAIARPALFIEARGADRDPSPKERGTRSLKGGSAARIARALCDWKPPVGVRELATRAQASAGYTTRVLTLLENENVIMRDKKGGVATVNWRGLLQRWAQDYAVAETNRAFAFLEPRSTEAFLERLEDYAGQWALTGSRAVPRTASSASSRSVTCYGEDPEQAARDLGLRSVDSGANVTLLEPFDLVIWQRTRREANLVTVAVSQCAVDLLTGTGREPSEAQTLLSWMGDNEDAWRRGPALHRGAQRQVQGLHQLAELGPPEAKRIED